ncbi:MAG: formate dehydrogenase accessory sulfurtransferase FdhD [Nitrospirota bacterium]
MFIVPDAVGIVEIFARKVDDRGVTVQSEKLAVEEPLEIRLRYSVGKTRETKAISITMRTPGFDEELAVGFLFSENIIKNARDIISIVHCTPFSIKDKENTILVELSEDCQCDIQRLERHFYTTSSCGVCGKTSLEALGIHAQRVSEDSLVIPAEIIKALPASLAQHQSVFNETGGLHASALFDDKGNLQCVREDVGRHNALDKIVGKALLAGEIPLNNNILLLSGRASFELIQKAIVAGIPIVAAIGAPSSLAVALARAFNITLLGFVRNGRFTIYSCDQRVGL